MPLNKENTFPSRTYPTQSGSARVPRASVQTSCSLGRYPSATSLSLLLPSYSQGILARITDQSLLRVRRGRSYGPAAHVPSSKVTHRVPPACKELKNGSAVVSRMDPVHACPYRALSLGYA
jgi:hypothetical protein